MMVMFAGLDRISNREIREIVITPVLLRCGVGSGSVTYGTVCFLTTHSPRLRKRRIGVSGDLAPPEDILLRRIRLNDFYPALVRNAG
ncbi:MAG TPA: hypothetical protein PLN69_00665 [bacterium]|nr:hypothetical protein [bacterium]